jgi:hypothetical protein
VKVRLGWEEQASFTVSVSTRNQFSQNFMSPASPHPTPNRRALGRLAFAGVFRIEPRKYVKNRKKMHCEAKILFAAPSFSP